MNNQQELNKSLSMPSLNGGEEAVIKKVQEQEGIISLMQTQIEFQSDVISKHEKLFEDVLSKIQDLSAKIKVLEEGFNHKKESADREAATSALWTTSVPQNTETKTSIADLVKETAEQTLGSDAVSGYVFDEKSGLYFDQNSGYYYDPVKQLFYNGHTQTFYSYDSATNTYHLHSPDPVKRKKGKKQKKVTKHQKISNSNENKETPDGEALTRNTALQKGDIPEIFENNSSDIPPSPGKPTTTSDMEEGEISSSVPTSAESSPAPVNDSESESCDSQDETAKYPPCIRAVVQTSSNSTDLKKGTLFLVPCTGGTVGSSGSHHAILLPSPSVDETHAKIHYQDIKDCEGVYEADDESGKYFIEDLGSQNGTYLNKTRLSESGVPSTPHEVPHGSTLQIGDVVLTLHIHPFQLTCANCEPGLILQKDPLYKYTGKTQESTRRSEMKKIKKKYGLDKKNENVNRSISDSTYHDRAKSRRAKVGSDNPFAKTEVASADVPIRENNVGFKMLQKMGWKGEGLGAPDNTGITEPIKCEGKSDRGGLGLSSSGGIPAPRALDKPAKKRSENLAKTLERFKDADVFPNSPKKEVEDDLDF